MQHLGLFVSQNTILSDPAKLFPKNSNLSSEDWLRKDRSEGQKTTLSLFRIIMESLYVTRREKLVKHVPLTTRCPPPDIILINDASARRGMTMAGAAVNVLAINTASSPVTNTTANPSLTPHRGLRLVKAQPISSHQ